MANNIKYKPQIWGEPIEGERLSTNGHYTGEQRGTTTQDALVEMPKHFVEETIIRRGTITQDAIEGSTPKVSSGAKLIEFSIDGDSGDLNYTAEEGMTWEEFMNSEYNSYHHWCPDKAAETDDANVEIKIFSVETDVCCHSCEGCGGFDGSVFYAGEQIKTSDVIVADAVYYLDFGE